MVEASTSGGKRPSAGEGICSCAHGRSNGGEAWSSHVRRHPPQLLWEHQHKNCQAACLRVALGDARQRLSKSIFSSETTSWSRFSITFEARMACIDGQTPAIAHTSKARELPGKRHLTVRMARYRGRMARCPRSSCARALSDASGTATAPSRPGTQKLNSRALRVRSGRPKNRQYSPHRRPLEGSWQHWGLWEVWVGVSALFSSSPLSPAHICGRRRGER